MLSDTDKYHYSKQISLPEISTQGQEILKNSRVLCVGVGGLGSPAALYLAAAGIGHIGLVDNDTVEESNLPRQILFQSKDIKEKKAAIAACRLKEINPTITIESIPHRFDLASAMGILCGYDVIIDGTDNFSSKFLINDAAVKANLPVIYGSIYQFEGQVSIFWAKHGPCYRCFLKEPPRETIQNCNEAGVLGPVAGVIGCIQTIETIKVLLFKNTDTIKLDSLLIGKLLFFDGLKMRFSKVHIPKNPQCKICSIAPHEIELHEETQTSCIASNEITSTELLKNNYFKKCIIIDVREQSEWQTSHIPNAVNWPLSELEAGKKPILDFLNHYVIYCRSGVRSKKALELLNHSGNSMQHLRGGLNSWEGPIVLNEQ